MWNEFTRRRESKRASWLGTNEQLARMSSDAACILTGRAVPGQPCSANTMHVPTVALLPGAKVLTPDAVPIARDLERMAAYFITPTAVESADMIAVHAYAYSGTDGASPESTKSGLAKQREDIGRVLPPSAQSLPIWSTEGSWGDSTANLPDPDIQ